MSVMLRVLGRVPTSGLKPKPKTLPSSMVMRHLDFVPGLLPVGIEPSEKPVWLVLEQWGLTRMA